MNKQVRLDCKACNQTKSMIPSKIYKMSPIVVFIGWILTIPSVLGVLFAVVYFLEILKTMNTDFGIGMGFIIALIIGIPSLVLGLLGYLLIMKKKVYQCENCNSIINRA